MMVSRDDDDDDNDDGSGHDGERKEQQQQRQPSSGGDEQFSFNLARGVKRLKNSPEQQEASEKLPSKIRHITP
jgi:hypothetical protein